MNMLRRSSERRLDDRVALKTNGRCTCAIRTEGVENDSVALETVQWKMW